MDPDVVKDGECDQSRHGCIRWACDRRREGAVLGVNFGRPIVTNGDFATRLFPNYFGVLVPCIEVECYTVENALGQMTIMLGINILA